MDVKEVYKVLKKNSEFKSNGSIKSVTLDQFQKMLQVEDTEFIAILEKLDSPEYAFKIRLSPCPE